MRLYARYSVGLGVEDRSRAGGEGCHAGEVVRGKGGGAGGCCDVLGLREVHGGGVALDVGFGGRFARHCGFGPREVKPLWLLRS